MAAPPSRTELADTYPNPSNAVMRTGIGKLWDYVTGLLGESGDADDAADALGAYRKGTILGTVSQSSGVPTGAIIERGSNANGEYVRFADGTQICTLSKTIDASVSAGSPASSGTTHAATFVSTPIVAASAVFYSGAGATGTRYYGSAFPSSDGTSALLNTGVSPSSAFPSFVLGSGNALSYHLEQVAVGRWF